MTTTFVAVYRGRTVSSAQLLAVSADPELVNYFAERLLHPEEEKKPGGPTAPSVRKRAAER